MKFIYLLLSVLPSFLHVFIRNMLGSKIERNVKIGFGSLIFSSKIEIKSGTRIGPFCFIKGNDIKIGNNSSIKPFSLVSARKIDIGNNIQIAPLVIISGDNTPRSKFEIGNHSRIFPFCWIDTGEGVTIGKHVGIGGHTLIFTHGVWSNYLDGGPVTFAPVIIEDDVWLPWRVFVMPGVTIGKRSIVGANSVVNKTIPENSLVAGSPAKVLKENFMNVPSISEQKVLLQNIFKGYIEYKALENITLNEGRLHIDDWLISNSLSDISEKSIIFLLDVNDKFEANNLDEFKGMNIIYHPQKTAFIQKNNKIALDFISYLRRYGIRLNIFYNL